MNALEEIQAAIEKLNGLAAVLAIPHPLTTQRSEEIAATLRPTVDAQLGILKYAADGIRLWERVPYTLEVDLARAINGTHA